MSNVITTSSLKNNKNDYKQLSLVIKLKQKIANDFDFYRKKKL